MHSVFLFSVFSVLEIVIGLRPVAEGYESIERRRVDDRISSAAAVNRLVLICYENKYIRLFLHRILLMSIEQPARGHWVLTWIDVWLPWRGSR